MDCNFETACRPNLTELDSLYRAKTDFAAIHLGNTDSSTGESELTAQLNFPDKLRSHKPYLYARLYYLQTFIADDAARIGMYIGTHKLII